MEPDCTRWSGVEAAFGSNPPMVWFAVCNGDLLSASEYVSVELGFKEKILEFNAHNENTRNVCIFINSLQSK